MFLFRDYYVFISEGEEDLVKQSFEEVYEAYFDDVYRYVRWKMPSDWETDDVVSEVFQKAFVHFSKAQKTDKKGWLIAIARTTVADYYRMKREDTLSIDEIVLVDQGKPFDQRLEEDEELFCLDKALNQLDEDDRETISLRYFAELRFDDIAQIRNKKVGTVKTQTYRMIKKIGVLVRICLEGKNLHES